MERNDIRQQNRDTFSINLKKASKIKGITQMEIATFFGLPFSTVNSWFIGKAIPRDETLIDLAKFLDVGIEDLLLDDTARVEIMSADSVLIPVYKFIQCGKPTLTEDDIETYMSISTKEAKRGEFFGVYVKGNSMLPEFKEKDILIVRRQNDVETGEIAIVKVGKDEVTCKKVLKRPPVNPDGIILQPLNMNEHEPIYYTNERIESEPIVIIGKVVGLKRTY